MRVAAETLQYLDLPLDSPAVRGGAQAAEVVVVADALDLHVLAVEEKSLVLRELDGADAEGRAQGIHEHGADADLADRLIKQRRFARPALRAGHGQDLLHRRAGVGGDGLPGLQPRHFLAARVQ